MGKRRTARTFGRDGRGAEEEHESERVRRNRTFSNVHAADTWKVSAAWKTMVMD